VRTANDDKSLTTSDHLTLNLSDASTVYVAYDPRATTLPVWLASDWRKIGRLDVQTTDPYQDSLDVYAREYPSGQFTLGGNLAGGGAGAETNYVVLVPQGAQVTVVSVSSGKSYDVVTAAESVAYYIDRTYTVAGFGGAVGVATVTMEYVQLNRMTKYTGPEGTEEFAYRGAEWHRCGADSTGFMYDGDNVVADVAGGDVDRTYVTPFLDQNLSMTTSAGAFYYSQDGLGSVRTVTDASATTVNRYYYLPFGEKLTPGTAVVAEERYTHSGREESPLGPLLYYRHRYFDPRPGVFMERDPIFRLDPRAQSLQSFVRQSPHNFRDPFGLSWERVGESEVMAGIVWTTNGSPWPHSEVFSVEVTYYDAWEELYNDCCLQHWAREVVTDTFTGTRELQTQKMKFETYGEYEESSGMDTAAWLFSYLPGVGPVANSLAMGSDTSTFYVLEGVRYEAFEGSDARIREVGSRVIWVEEAEVAQSYVVLCSDVVGVHKTKAEIEMRKGVILYRAREETFSDPF